MREVIRQQLEERRRETMNQPTVGLTAEQLESILTRVIAEGKKLNPIEQKEFDDKVKQEERKRKMMLVVGKEEEDSMRRKRDQCSHSRYPAGSGKRAGHSCPRGQGEWATGAHIHSDDVVTVICMRCATPWRFRATPAERQNIIDGDGGISIAPPPPERELKPCPHCATEYDGREFQQHEATCERKLVAV